MTHNGMTPLRIAHRSATRGPVPLERHRVLTSRDPDVVREGATTLLARHRMEFDGATTALAADIRHVRIAGMSLMGFHYGTAVRISGRPLRTFATVHLPLRGRLEIGYRGERLVAGPRRGAVFSSTSPMEMRWSGDLSLLVLRVEQTAVEERLQNLIDRPIDQPVAFDPGVDVTGADAGLAGAVRALLGTIDSCGPGGLPPVVATEFERTILNLLLLSHRHNYSGRLTEYVALPPPRIVSTVLEHIDATPEGTLSVGELARAAGVGERALHLAFRRYLGTTPAAYLRQVRLERAHADLVAGRPEDGTTVTDIALLHGFAHGGRFAAAYRRRFGEPPSVTLQR
ncbi:AraC family transcriptional regulator [Pseudonocardia sp. NPDC049635]|uniref:AraC family transcriptional regulator n=1 Tax=Pseudonocardia sp. NPDC049635 TaxID=3155506 RepID=UPI0034105B5F